MSRYGSTLVWQFSQSNLPLGFADYYPQEGEFWIHISLSESATFPDKHSVTARFTGCTSVVFEEVDQLVDMSAFAGQGLHRLSTQGLKLFAEDCELEHPESGGFVLFAPPTSMSTMMPKFNMLIIAAEAVEAARLAPSS